MLVFRRLGGCGTIGENELPTGCLASIYFCMPSTMTSEHPIFTTDDDGVRRVAGTRVPLDTVVFAFRDGATPEEIVQQYPALELADAYEAVTHYLRHRGDVDAYLAQHEAAARTVRVENERRFPAVGVRERLLARKRGE